MASPLTAKRRRLNNASNTLTRPFVSPLKPADSANANNTTTPTKSRRSNVPVNTNTPYVPSTLARTINAATSRTPHKPQSNPASAHTPIRNSVRKNAYSTPFAKRLDPAEQALQRDITAIELQIKSVRNDIDLLNQAAKYSGDATDHDLEELAVKWKLASQSAAEEIFGTVKERVNRMGGVQAWRDSEKQKYERSNGMGEFAEPEVEDDADCEFDSQGEELPEDEQEYRKKEKRRVRREAEEAADVDEPVVEDATGPTQVWQQGGGDDDVSQLPLTALLIETNEIQSFTMDMMLRSLNIELKVIGYDKHGQRWYT
jgi:Swi5-dependent recombination DNA repair protein 1